MPNNGTASHSTNRKVKVVHLDFSGSGVMTHVLSILDHANRDRFETTVIYSNDDRPGLSNYAGALKQRDINGVPLHVLRELGPKDIGILMQVHKVIQKINPDVIHCHSTKAGLIGRSCAAMLGKKPAVYTPHAFSFHMSRPGSLKHKVLTSLERIQRPVTSRIIAISQTEFDLAVDEKICPPERVALIHNGVDLRQIDEACSHRAAKREELGAKPDEVLLCFLGRLAPQKMPHLVVEALDILRKTGMRPTLLVIGEGPSEEEIRAMVAERGLGDQFRWLGWMPHDPALQYLAAADILLMPSKYEGMPYTALEAQASRVVPVITEVPGSRDAVIHGETGLAVPYNDAQAVADAVRRLIDDGDLRRRLAEAGRDHVNRNFNVKDMVLKLEETYLEILKR